MAAELDDHGLDPDMMLDMPEQQTGGLFGITRSDSMDSQQDGLYAHFGSTTASSGPFSPSTTAMDPLAQLDPSHFSLADELAGAMDSSHDNIGNLMAELDDGSGAAEYINDISSSLPTPDVSPRRLKSSKDTSSSARTENLQENAHEQALSSELEDGLKTLNDALADIETFRIKLKEQDKAASTADLPLLDDADTRLEHLATQVIRDFYESVKRQQEDTKLLNQLAQDLQHELIWMGLDATKVAESEGTRSAPANAPSSGKHKQSRLSDLQEDDFLETGVQGDVKSRTEKPIPLVEALSSLRKHTEAVATSMSAINEHLQVSKAAGSDVSRKLRAIESAVGRLKSEAEAVNASQARIEFWETHKYQPSDAIDEKRTRDYHKPEPLEEHQYGNIKEGGRHFQDEAKMQMSSALSSLEDAYATAKKLLIYPG